MLLIEYHQVHLPHLSLFLALTLLVQRECNPESQEYSKSYCSGRSGKDLGLLQLNLMAY